MSSQRIAGELLRALVCLLATAAVVMLVYLADPLASCDTDAECAAVHGGWAPTPLDWSRGADGGAP